MKMIAFPVTFRYIVASTRNERERPGSVGRIDQVEREMLQTSGRGKRVQHDNEDMKKSWSLQMYWSQEEKGIPATQVDKTYNEKF
jgi:hypothetical protein